MPSSWCKQGFNEGVQVGRAEERAALTDHLRQKLDAITDITEGTACEALVDTLTWIENRSEK